MRSLARVLLLHLHSLQFQDASFLQLPARSPVKESDPVLLLLRLQVSFCIAVFTFTIVSFVGGLV